MALGGPSCLSTPAAPRAMRPGPSDSRALPSAAKGWEVLLTGAPPARVPVVAANARPQLMGMASVAEICGAGGTGPGAGPYRADEVVPVLAPHVGTACDVDAQLLVATQQAPGGAGGEGGPLPAGQHAFHQGWAGARAEIQGPQGGLRSKPQESAPHPPDQPLHRPPPGSPEPFSAPWGPHPRGKRLFGAATQRSENQALCVGQKMASFQRGPRRAMALSAVLLEKALTWGLWPGPPPRGRQPTA